MRRICSHNIILTMVSISLSLNSFIRNPPPLPPFPVVLSSLYKVFSTHLYITMWKESNSFFFALKALESVWVCVCARALRHEHAKKCEEKRHRCIVLGSKVKLFSQRHIWFINHRLDGYLRIFRLSYRVDYFSPHNRLQSASYYVRDQSLGYRSHLFGKPWSNVARSQRIQRWFSR